MVIYGNATGTLFYHRAPHDATRGIQLVVRILRISPQRSTQGVLIFTFVNAIHQKPWKFRNHPGNPEICSRKVNCGWWKYRTLLDGSIANFKIFSPLDKIFGSSGKVFITVQTNTTNSAPL